MRRGDYRLQIPLEDGEVFIVEIKVCKKIKRLWIYMEYIGKQIMQDDNQWIDY